MESDATFSATIKAYVGRVAIRATGLFNVAIAKYVIQRADAAGAHVISLWNGRISASRTERPLTLQRHDALAIAQILSDTRAPKSHEDSWGLAARAALVRYAG
jgi:hypothetical protein